MDEIKDQKKSDEKKQIVQDNKAKEQFFSFEKVLNSKFLIILLATIIFTISSRIKYFASTSIWNDAAVHLGYSLRFLQNPSFLFSSQYLTQDYITIQTLTAIVQIFTQNILLSGKIVALLFALIGIISAYFLGKQLKSKWTGIIASILLSTQYLFFFYSTRPLADAPLASMFILTTYALIYAFKQKNKKWSIFAGILILLTIATKAPGVILLIGVIAYLLITKRKELFKEHIVYSWAIPLGTIIVFGLFALIVFGQNIFQKLFFSFFNFAGMGTGFEVTSQIPSLVGMPLLILAIIGAIFSYLYKSKEYLLPIIISITFWVWFEVGVRSTLDRYLLPLIPIILLFAAVGIEELANIIKTLSKNELLKVITIVLITAFIATSGIEKGYNITDAKVFSYTGYFEATEYLNEHMPQNAVLIAGSYRPLRAFTVRELVEVNQDTNYEDVKGKIVNLRAEKYTQENGKEIFEQDINKLKTLNIPIYLEIDIWEYTQPTWYYQISIQSIEYFESQGFEVVNVINKQIRPDLKEPQSAVFLLKYSP